MERQAQLHNILPLYDEKSRVLILGSVPVGQVKGGGVFLRTPGQNRFWPTLAAVLGEETPKTVKEKKAMSCAAASAMWDTIGSCEIVGSSDASITNVVPNDLSVILDAADIQAIFCNGGTSYACYKKYCRAEARARGRPASLHLAGQRALDEGKAYRSVGRSAETVSFLTRR